MDDRQDVPVVVEAPAKVNLYLHVTGRRADGYHELDSLFVRAAVSDRLTFRTAEDLSLTISGPFAAALAGDENNLVLAAGRRLASELGHQAGAQVHLDKTLPVAAGIGGGSADAAATLLGLAQLWRADIGKGRLRALAGELGADVPACLERMPLQVSGIGERLRPAAALPPAWLVLVNPGVAVPTAEVFRVFGGKFSAAMPLGEALASVADLARALGERRNDLEAAAMTLAPAIADVLHALAGEAGILLARMSGSGATCFGLAACEAEAQAAAGRIAAARPGWWVAAAPILVDPTPAEPLPLGRETR